jgi:antitoxin HigA-1
MRAPRWRLSVSRRRGSPPRIASRSSILAEGHRGRAAKSHPGNILKQEFLEPISLSQNKLAHAIGVPPNRIHAIVAGARRVTADTDLRLCRFFALSEGYFLRLQNAFDTLEAKRRAAKEIARIRPFKADAA